MKFSFLTVKIVFFLLLVFFLGCSEEDLTPKDETPPSVTSVNISEGEEIEPPFEIIINFSEDINIASLYKIQISGLSTSIEAAGSTIVVKIPEDVKPGRYTLVISGVEDTAGNIMWTEATTVIGFLIPSPFIELLVGTWVVVLIDGQSPDEILWQSGLDELEKDMPAGGSIDCSYSIQFLFEEDKDFHIQVLATVTMDFGDPVVPPIKINIKQTGSGGYNVSGNTLNTTIISTDTTINIFPKELEKAMKPDMEPIANELSEEFFGDEKYKFTVVENYLTLKESDGSEVIFKRK